MKIASERKQPIPVYAEMSSINPVVLFPNALRNRAEEIGTAFVSSLILGAGQFCTNPGLILAIDDPNLDRFIASATSGSLPHLRRPCSRMAFARLTKRVSRNSAVVPT